MELNTFNIIVRELKDCEDYLQGKVHTKDIQDIADVGAKQAVTAQRDKLLKQLMDAGLRLNGLSNG